MTSDRKSLILPILLITIGIGWLLTTIGVMPRVDWVWTLGLLVAGLLVFVAGGIDKVTIVVGPFLIAAGCLSLLRQTGRLDTNVEVPVLVIVAGVLLLFARMPAVPIPKWVTEDVRK